MEREVERRRKERETAFAAYRNITVGKVNALNGSIDVPGRPGFVWVSTLGLSGSRYAAFNKGFSLLDQTPVMLSVSPQRPFRWEIIDLYTGDATPQTGGNPGTFKLPLHATNHQIPSEAAPGKDPVTVFQPAVDMLKSKAEVGLVISVRPLVYMYQQEYVLFVGTGAVSLSSHVPGTAANHRWVLIYLDPVTNTVLVEAGAIVATSSPAVKPTILTDTIPSAFFLLENGQTTLSMVDDYVDARPFLSLNSVAGNPVTLSVEADTILELTDQEIDLDTQADNTFLAGSVTGGPDKPTFRAIDVADLTALEITRSLIVPLATGWNITDGTQLAWDVDTTIFSAGSNNWIGLIMPDNKYSAVMSALFTVPVDLKPSTSLTISALYVGPSLALDAYGKLGYITSTIECNDLSAGTGVITAAGADDLSLTKCLRQGSAAIVPGDLVQFRYARDATDVLDTVGGDVEVGGFLVSYTAIR
jgi:hypothetical protein